MTSDTDLDVAGGRGKELLASRRTAGTGFRSRRPLGDAPSVRLRWEYRFRRSVVIADIAALLGTIGIVQALRFYPAVGIFENTLTPALGVTVGLVALLSLYATGAWDRNVLGQGSEEFSRLVRAYVIAGVIVGLSGLAFEITAVRPWVFGVVPFVAALSFLQRFLLRKHLHRRRRNGQCLHSVLAVGAPESVADLIRRTRRDPYNGWAVSAACTATGTGLDGSGEVLGVPVLGDLDAVSNAIRRGSFRVVAVSTGPGWTPIRLRRLAWDLEGQGADLVVDPGLMEMAGPRLHVAPVDGLPLLRLTHPTLTGISWMLKSAIDIAGAAVLILVLAPILLVAAIAARADGGPVLFRQERVGRDGSVFRMMKFRSMVVDAEERKAELAGLDNGAGPLFKVRSDPRVTRVGAVLRRYSLDELPQLFNVLAGSMSLVGPRPPLPSEVVSYSHDASRKFRVKPGLTGLWQVSGRSDLSWEESVRLDLRYVENWTLAMDALILWKTVGAVFRGGGAY